ncbi:uncharacterized protein ACA1_157190 [Acanthamoeba castellanii str. Neff]|uniref:Uncharacterized protein n=1 Tax=Acanthamoeba castellanii (strain ATCC 30010 / Neff) TaxID=1257118 RepID=L8H9S9_ACACF|nr:uncharacterized protein ACA1_157190 [Acanthamoeba castellanii str. Neff]ELR21997.1 hypothetical protein ACA1_157190 [Acanthamoeba castellanii str. Neff]
MLATQTNTTASTSRLARPGRGHCQAAGGGGRHRGRQLCQWSGGGQGRRVRDRAGWRPRPRLPGRCGRVRPGRPGGQALGPPRHVGQQLGRVHGRAAGRRDRGRRRPPPGGQLQGHPVGHPGRLHSSHLAVNYKGTLWGIQAASTVARFHCTNQHTNGRRVERGGRGTDEDGGQGAGSAGHPRQLGRAGRPDPSRAPLRHGRGGGPHRGLPGQPAGQLGDRPEHRTRRRLLDQY